MFGNRIPQGVLGGVLAVLAGVAFYLNRPEGAETVSPEVQSNRYVPFDQRASGLGQVQVETLAGDEPGYADGPLWQARFCGPTALALETDGALLVCDSRNHRIRRISPAGEVTTVAGGGEVGGTGGKAEGAALSARFRYPAGVAVGRDGTIFIADTGNHRICALSDGEVHTLAGSGPGSADGTGTSAQFRAPGALLLGPDAAIWVADAGNRKIRRLTRTGLVSTPKQVPASVRQSLGDCETAHQAVQIVASTMERSVSLSRTRFMTGSRTFSGGERLPIITFASNREAPRLFTDFKRNLVLLDNGGGTATLLAGAVEKGAVGPHASVDGRGDQARFVGPCAVVATRDGTAYVAEYDGNRIRRVLLSAPVLNHVAAARINTFYTD